MQKRCPKCQPFTLSALAGGHQYAHYSTLTSLEESANNDCDLCRLIWEALTSNMNKEALASVRARKFQQITLQSNHVNMKIMSELKGHSAFDGIWVDCAREENDQNAAGIFGPIELFTSRRNPLARWFNGRDIPCDPSSTENFDDIKGWLEVCSKHSACTVMKKASLPKRVLDVGVIGSPNVQLSITEGQMGSFLALSYCWGASESVTTTFSSLDKHLRGILVAQLPATIADSIEVTRRLGFKYLWVDALCILQPRFNGDPEAFQDWQEQSSKMGDIYGNAYLTIAAGAATDKHEGCFIHDVEQYLSCEVALDDPRLESGIYARCPLNPSKKYLYKSALERRAWTFQEELLSQRLLLYDKNEISLTCRTTTFSPRAGSTAGPESIGTITKGRGPMLFSIPNVQGIPKPQDKETNAYRMLQNWYTRLESNFCGRALTHDSDILPALSGVAHRIQPEIGGSYYAGIWETDLIRGLLWKTRRILPQGKEKLLMRPNTYRAPSWSWASVNGEIYYGITPNSTLRWKKEKEQCPAKIVETSTTLVGPIFDPMGQVIRGFLKVHSLLRSAVVITRAESDFKKHWTDSKGVLRSHLPANAWDLLVGCEVVDTYKSDAVGALGAFDIENERSGVVFCALLTLKEGLLLEKVKHDGDEFRRVGFFQLENKNWFDGCSSEPLTII